MFINREHSFQFMIHVEIDISCLLTKYWTTEKLQVLNPLIQFLTPFLNVFQCFVLFFYTQKSPQTPFADQRLELGSPAKLYKL